MQNEFDKTVLKMTQLILEDPKCASKFLQVISNSLEEYEKAQKAKRELLSYHAIQGLMVLDKKNKKDRKALYPCYFHAAFAQFPKGECSYHLNSETKFWHEFIELTKENHISGRFDDKWIAQHQGEDALEWFHKYVQPELNNIEET